MWLSRIYDPASGQEIACQEVFWPSYGWSWQKAPPTEGVNMRGTPCDGQRAYSNSRTADGYRIECLPPGFTNNEIAGPGSVWSQPTNKHDIIASHVNGAYPEFTGIVLRSPLY